MIDGPLGAHRAAAADAESQIGLIDVLHDELARAGEADPAEGAARQGDLDIARSPGLVTVEHDPAAADLDMGENVGRSARDQVAAVAAAIAHGRRQGDLDGIAALPGPTAFRWSRIGFAAAIAARLANQGAEPEAVQITTAQGIGKGEADNADAEAAGGDPAQSFSHVRLPDRPCSAIRSAAGRTCRAGGRRSRSSSATARRRRCPHPAGRARSASAPGNERQTSRSS